jgi:hypothetical protein
MALPFGGRKLRQFTLVKKGRYRPLDNPTSPLNLTLVRRDPDMDTQTFLEGLP